MLGPSGSGKTTLLNVIGALDAATEGRVVVGGVDITCSDRKQLARYRRHTVSFIFQTFNLFPGLTAFENVRFGADASGRSNDTSFARLRMHDLRVSLAAEGSVRAGALAAAATAIPHRQLIAVTQERLIIPTQVDASVPGGSLLVPGKIVGVPLAGADSGIDTRFTRKGRDLRPPTPARPWPRSRATSASTTACRSRPMFGSPAGSRCA